MKDTGPSRRFGAVTIVLGLVVVGTYLTSSIGYFPGPEKLALVAFFAIGPVAIIGVLAIRRRLASSGDGFWPDVGTTFLVVAFALFNLMLVVQQYVALRVRESLAATGADALDTAAQETLRGVWKVVDYVQQGIDVSFDIFYCLGIILVSSAMVRHPRFGRILGYFGMLSAAALLILNLGAFPHIPADSGLVDLGPLTGVWWLLVILQMARMDWRERRGGGGIARTGATPL